MKKLPTTLALFAGISAALLGTSSAALATACPATPSCTVSGTTYSETGVSSGNGLTFLASFPTANQSNATIAADVLAFLDADGFAGVFYLGRQDGSGLIDGDHISTSSSDGGLTGTWTFTPGTTGAVGGFVAIHAGNGQSDEELFEINSPGLSGTWSTFNGHGLSNFDLFSTDPLPTGVPEPITLSLFGAGLVGAASMRRRKAKRA